MLLGGELLAWFDRRSHHLVTFEATWEHADWAPALAGLVAAGRARRVEIRKVDGASAIPEPIADVARAAGFVDSYRGLVYPGSSCWRFAHGAARFDLAHAASLTLHSRSGHAGSPVRSGHASCETATERDQIARGTERDQIVWAVRTRCCTRG